MDVAFALAIALEAYALDSIVVLESEAQRRGEPHRDARTRPRLVASAGRSVGARALATYAASMTRGEPIGAWRKLDGGRVHVEVVALCGAPCVVAVRGHVALDDPRAITSALHASFPADAPHEAPAPAEADDDDDDFDFDLGWGDSPTDALRDVVG